MDKSAANADVDNRIAVKAACSKDVDQSLGETSKCVSVCHLQPEPKTAEATPCLPHRGGKKAHRSVQPEGDAPVEFSSREDRLFPSLVKTVVGISEGLI